MELAGMIVDQARAMREADMQHLACTIRVTLKRRYSIMHASRGIQFIACWWSFKFMVVSAVDKTALGTNLMIASCRMAVHRSN